VSSTHYEHFVRAALRGTCRWRGWEGAIDGARHDNSRCERKRWNRQDLCSRQPSHFHEGRPIVRLRRRGAQRPHLLKAEDNPPRAGLQARSLDKGREVRLLREVRGPLPVPRHIGSPEEGLSLPRALPQLRGMHLSVPSRGHRRGEEQDRDGQGRLQRRLKDSLRRARSGRAHGLSVD